MFVCTQDEADELKSYNWAVKHLKDNFGYFVRVTVGAYIYHEAHVPGLLERNAARANVIGAIITEYYPEWQDLFSRNNIRRDVRQRLSITIARMIVGHEGPFIQKLRVRHNLSDLSNTELRVVLDTELNDDRCIEVTSLRTAIWNHFRM